MEGTDQQNACNRHRDSRPDCALLLHERFSDTPIGFHRRCTDKCGAGQDAPGPPTGPAELWQGKCNGTTVKSNGGCPMKTKMTCIAILLAFGFLTATASADQSYRFTLSQPSRIGNTELQPGDYRLVVDAPKVVLPALNTSKSKKLGEKFESRDQNFPTPEFNWSKVNALARSERSGSE